MEIFKNVSLYEKMIKYAKSVVIKNKSNICHIDLVHDLILLKEITEDNFLQEIKSIFLVERRSKDKSTDINSLAFEWHGTKTTENVCSNACKKCQESYPIDFFRKRILKNGFVQIYYICKKCESIDSNERRKKTDKINELTHKQKYHLKKKANDPEYLKKKVKEMQDYRKRKALEKQST